MSLPKVIVILGPTASGKTALSLKLAKQFNGEIISADSRQVYREMNIGTAKASAAELKAVKHYLVDSINPDESYTLGQYKRDAVKYINLIQHKGKTPFLVGGTGLYLWALIANLDIPEIKPDRKLRARLEKMVKRHGLYYAYGRLTALDPEAAYIVDPKNPRRVLRALEIAILTKKPFSATRKTGPPLFAPLILGIGVPQEKLKSNINSRVEAMMRAGLVTEVKNLLKKYGKRKLPFDAIGYREVISYLAGEITRDQAAELIKSNTWKFAKRQYTWFKKLPVLWINTHKQAETEIKKFLKD